MNLLYIPLFILGKADVSPSPKDIGFELAIWKWVVIIAAGAFVIIFLIRRFADVAAKRKTAAIIEDVVGNNESKNPSEWEDDESE